MMLYQIEVQRTMRTVYEVEAPDEKAAIAALSETEECPLVDEEVDSEIMSVIAALPHQEERKDATDAPSD